MGVYSIVTDLYNRITLDLFFPRSSTCFVDSCTELRVSWFRVRDRVVYWLEKTDTR